VVFEEKIVDVEGLQTAVKAVVGQEVVGEEEQGFSSVAAGDSYKRGVVVAIILAAVGALYLIFQGVETDKKIEKTPTAQIQERSQTEAKKLVENAVPAPNIEKIEITQAPKLPEVPPIKEPQPPSPPPPPVPSAPQMPSIARSAPTNQPGVIPPPGGAVPNVSAPISAPQAVVAGSSNESQKMFNFSSKEEEEMKRKALEARRKSSIIVTGGGSSNGDGKSDKGGKDDKEKSAQTKPKDNSEYLGFGEGAFGEAALAKTSANQVKATHIGRLDTIIAEGKIIHAVLETAINTDLPGSLRAIITRDVYAESGKGVLIPKGSRVIGSYETQVKTGQSRVAVIWNRLIRPDGVDLALNSVGVDALGRSGIGGFADDKFLTKLANALLISYVVPVAAGRIFSKPSQSKSPVTTTSTTNASTGTTTTSSTATLEQQQLKESQDKFNEVVGKALEDTFSTKTTIYVDQGTEVNIFVNRDLIFPSDGTMGGIKLVK
jgi:type IV secretion system protein VirB10